MKFRGKSIFGSQVRQSGPIPKARHMRESIPGVRGFRIYLIHGTGVDTRTFTMRGRLVAVSLKSLQKAISDYQDMIGTFGDFIDSGGQRWRNCMLNDYRPATGFMPCHYQGALYFTCEVSGTVETAT